MDTEPASLKFIEDHGITFPNGPDLRGEISKIYRVNAVPETYILDTERRLRYVKFGSFLSSSEITAAINQVKAAD
jgi:peroxiredoxin